MFDLATYGETNGETGTLRAGVVQLNSRPHQALGYRTPAEVFHGDQAVREEESKERRCLPEPVLSSYPGAVGPPQCQPEPQQESS